MEIYETEEQQLEALKKWWQKNGSSAIVGLVLGTAIILGWNYWQGYQKSQLEEASALYIELQKAVEANNKDSADKLAERIQTEFKNTQYAAYSGLLSAKLKVQNNDIAAAKQILERIGASSSKEISNIAKIRLVRLLLVNKEYEQGLKLINEIDPATTDSFSGLYDELVGDLYVGLGRFDQARTSYQSALRNGQGSPMLQIKLDDLTVPDKLENK